jgi:hypothetical protein
VQVVFKDEQIDIAIAEFIVEVCFFYQRTHSTGERAKVHTQLF